MLKKDLFKQEITKSFSYKGPSIILGAAKLEGEALTDHFVRIPLKTLNRHGLIAGATGTGKTKTLQIIIEQLSAQGVASLVMDIKGDLSGVAAKGELNPKIQERHDAIGFPFSSDTSPVEFMTLSHDTGLRLRATVSEFGPILFSKILDLNDTQGGIVSLVFKYCDDNALPILDLNDFKKVLNYISNEGKEEIKAEYGTVSSASIGTILRKIIELEQQGADLFFGERSFDVNDLCRFDENGKGYISILRVTDIQDKPKLFSTFMLQLLAEVYSIFPEEGDMDQPKLCIFIDEAHLIFNEASKVLLNQIETIVKLIRSKGIGVFFVTQNPTDVPRSVLSQLGLKVQHALRAFTAVDRKNIKLTAENYPLSDYYDVDQLLTELGIGEAIISALDEKGIPTPLVHCYLRAPHSRMDILTTSEINSILQSSKIKRKYDEVIDRESAYEILGAKIEEAQKSLEQELPSSSSSTRGRPRQEKSTLEKVLNSTTTRQIGRTVAQTLTRGLLGVFGLTSTGTKKTSSKKNNWF
ncbi:MAG: helicase HerA-like domain-containing protein [Saprospiraceae bacterium]